MLQVVDPILDIDDGLICLEVPVPRRVAIQVFLHGDDVLSRGPKLVRAFLEHPGAFVVQCLNLRVNVRHFRYPWLTTLTLTNMAGRVQPAIESIGRLGIVTLFVSVPKAF